MKEKHWSEYKEKGGSIWHMKLLFSLYRLLGKGFFQILLHPVVFFFYLCSPRTRRISRAYLSRVHSVSGDGGEVKSSEIYRHIFSFSYSLLEKLSAWAGDMHSSGMKEMTPGVKQLKEQLSRKEGAVIIGSHLGNMEMLRAFASLETGDYLPPFGIHSIVDFSGTAKFNQLLKEINPESMVHLVNASDISADRIISLQQAIEQGDLVIIAGDRTAKNNRMKNTCVSFLGDEAYFPQGAFTMATLLEGSIYYMFALRSDDRDLNSPYEFHVYPSEHPLGKSRRERKKILQNLTEEFVGHLEKLCLAHPSQWFNFYDFWEKRDS